MDILCARYVPSYEEWSDAFAECWKGTGIMHLPPEADRRYYFNFGYTPSRAVDICTDVDPTNAT